jgi:hypothetical protein
VHKGIFQEKNGKPEPFRFPQNFFLPVPERVNFGKGLPYFFFSQEGCLQDEKEMNYSKEEK